MTKSALFDEIEEALVVAIFRIEYLATFCDERHDNDNDEKFLPVLKATLTRLREERSMVPLYIMDAVKASENGTIRRTDEGRLRVAARQLAQLNGGEK